VPSADDDAAASASPDVDVSRMADSTTSAPSSAPPAPLTGDRPTLASSAPDAIAGDLGDRAADDVAPRSGAADLPLHVATPTTATTAAPLEPAIQRLADAGSPATATGAPPASGETGLVGDAPIASVGGHDDGGDDADEPAPPAPALPLAHARAAGDADDADDVAPSPVASVPTVGADAEPMVSVQPLPDTAGVPAPAPSTGTASLPLAPTDLGPTLKPPVVPANPDVRPPEASAAPTAAPLAPASSAAAPSVQRAMAPTTTPPGAGPLPFVRPIGAAAASLAVQRAVAGSAGAMSMLAPSASAPDSSLPVQLRRIDDGDLGGGVATVETLALSPLATSDGTPSASAPLPLSAPVQRLAPAATSGTPAAATAAANGRPPTPDLPLHTPATAIPSATDIAVRAGLAERGPGGEVFSTVPPAAVQRLAEPEATTSVTNNGDGTVSVQTLPPSAGVASATRGAVASPSLAASTGPSPIGEGAGGGEGNDAVSDTKKLAADAKKLYPFIRSALEADIRRQLEGKSRASRFRP
jgi:hypothetical protein